MRRPWHVGVVFGVCLAVVLAAMGWISLKVVQLDRAEVLARRQARLEENVRLALWRMESLLAPLIAQESARPYFAYTPFYPAERAYTRMFAEIQPNEVRLPSPLLIMTPPHVLVHFQIEPDGKIGSPQAPGSGMRETAERGYTTHARIELAEGQLSRLQSRLDQGRLWSTLPLGGMAATMPNTGGILANASLPQPVRSSVEGSKREAAASAALRSWTSPGSCEICPDVRQGMMRPMWVQDALILARRVSVDRKEYIQGCELDWPEIRQLLIADVTDLLPQADLRPVAAGSGEKQARMLAALPVQLIAGDAPVESAAEVSPIRISLMMAWVCVLVAATAVGVLLRGAVGLSERRGAFVSAVTHELRTPLTSLRMYTEMLAEGMLPDEKKRAEYVNTLRVEADRLAHLVENVLSYSRLERNRAGGQMVTLPLSELIAQVQPRLSQRAEQAGLSLMVPAAADTAGVSVRADASAVEQILFNLVDNACKYAADASERTIHVGCEHVDSRVAIHVRDHGPGVSPREARKLFRPFSKSARDAANSAPGVGLGLALSRRLARDMGGDLRLDGAAHAGACFVLILRCGDS